MTLFAWLLLAHLVGDWMLQNDWMARGKERGGATLACLIHCLLYTLTVLTVLLLVEPGLTAYDVAGAAAILFGSHWLIDGQRLAARWGALIGQSDLLFVRIVVDQTFHLVVLAALALRLPA